MGVCREWRTRTTTKGIFTHLACHVHETILDLFDRCRLGLYGDQAQWHEHSSVGRSWSGRDDLFIGVLGRDGLASACSATWSQGVLQGQDEHDWFADCRCDMYYSVAVDQAASTDLYLVHWVSSASYLSRHSCNTTIKEFDGKSFS